MNWHDYIISDSRILVGKPIIKGTRISVELILELLSMGWTEEMIFESYPHLSKESLNAVFSFLKDTFQNEMFFPYKMDLAS
jgi:uncharacterized protein (DUF433 family)